MTTTASFAEQVNHVANLDNSFALQMNISKNNVVLTSGAVYNTLSTLTMYNRTTGKSEVVSIPNASVTSATLNAHLAAIKTQVELAYPITMTHSVVSSLALPLTFNTVTISFTVSGSLYYIRDFDLQINLLTELKYLISGTLVDPIEVIPKLSLGMTTTVLDNIVVVGANISSVNTVAADVVNVDTVAGSIASINTVAGVQNLADITRVAQDLNSMDLNGIADVTIVANDLVLGVNSKINKVSADLANIDTVSANLVNIDTVALNIATVNGAIAAAATADADVVLTHADVVLTHADVVLTHADAAASAASAAAASASQTAAGISASAAATSEFNAAGSATTAANLVAPFTAHLTDVLNPHGVTKTQVGLGNVADIAQVTSVSATAPLVSSGTTTPTISMAAATALADGYMTSIYASKLDGIATGATANVGTVTSIDMTVPVGLAIAGVPITTSGTLALTMALGYSIPTDTLQANWNTAFSQTRQWDGGSTGLVAATGLTSLGGTTIGQSMFTLVNPTAITFPQFNANNTVSALDATTFRTAIGAAASAGVGTVTSVSGTAPISVVTGTTTPSISMAAATALVDGYMTSIYASKLDGISAGATANTGTVTSVGGTGTVNGLTLTGGVTTTGNLTLGGTLSISGSDFASQLANTVFASPDGIAGTPTFRSLVATDIPILNQNTTGSAATANALNAANAYTGTSFNGITGLASTAPLMDGVAAVGVGTTSARDDHVHPTDTTKADLATSAQRDSVTGAVFLGNGTTAQRPVLISTARAIWYNSDLSTFEGWNGTTWGAIGGASGGGATGGGTDQVFMETSYTVTANYTLTAGKSAITVGNSSGNVIIADGVAITIPTGSQWTILGA